MYKLLTFQKIGDKYKLDNDIILIISEIYMKDCLSYKNTLNYNLNRYNISENKDYYIHQTRIHLVNSQFKYHIKNFVSYQNLIRIMGINNITLKDLDQQLERLQYPPFFNDSLENHTKKGINNLMKYIKERQKLL